MCECVSDVCESISVMKGKPFSLRVCVCVCGGGGPWGGGGVRTCAFGVSVVFLKMISSAWARKKIQSLV